MARRSRSRATFLCNGSHTAWKKITALLYYRSRAKDFSFFSLFFFSFFPANFYGEKSNAIPGQVITFPPVYVMARLNSDSYKFETNNFITQVLQSGSIFFFFYYYSAILLSLLYSEDYSIN